MIDLLARHQASEYVITEATAVSILTFHLFLGHQKLPSQGALYKSYKVKAFKYVNKRSIIVQVPSCEKQPSLDT